VTGNLAALIVDPAARDGVFGTVDRPTTVAGAAAVAARLAVDLGGAAGERWALIGPTSTEYLICWMALQLAGKEVALVNPTYPPDLLAAMLGDLQPAAVAWVGREPDRGVAPDARHEDLSAAAADAATAPVDLDALPGLGRAPHDVAGYMHTSGSTGRPKFCAQSHEYFARLGRHVAGALDLSADDVVLAPLPMFHINPLGYGVVGALTAGAGVLGAERFSASAFWGDVKRHGVTRLVMHAPPIEILKRRTTAADAQGHRVGGMFYADDVFLDRFDIPWGVSAYGSTEAGGLSHTRRWGRGARPSTPGGMARYGGPSRADIEWRLDGADQIHVRERAPGAMFAGYMRDGRVDPGRDADGWFATGDLGRQVGDDDLVFLERAVESIRVKGEFVPIAFVEEHFASLAGLDDLALWKSPSELVDDEIVLFVAADAMPALADVRELAAGLPPFMRPGKVALVPAIPRLTGVAKVRRGELRLDDAVEVVQL
jgi:acyl-coenzyme A synthetase/AMP-(fatty) acid ligase